MDVLSLRLFLTFVLVAVMITAAPAQAVPTDPPPALDTPSSDESPEQTEVDAFKINTTDIARPPKKGPRTTLERSEYFFPYRRALSPQVGLIFDAAEIQAPKQLTYVVGVQYLFQIRSLNHYEAGADLVSNGSGYIHLARRWIFTRGRFRPYTKVGGALHVIPRETLSTFVKVENYEARAAIGFENLLAPPLSFRTEFELAASTTAISGLVKLGYSWAW